MPATRSDHRYVLAVGQVAGEVVALEDAHLLTRLDQVVLVQTSLTTAAALRRMKSPHVHIYSSERAARTAFALFQADDRGRGGQVGSDA